MLKYMQVTMKSFALVVLALLGAFVTINAYPSVKGVPSQVSDVKGLKLPPSPGYYDRPSKVGQAKDDVKGVKTVPVQQQQQEPQQVQDEVKGVQQRDQVKGQVPAVPQYPVKGVQQKDPVKGISQQPVKGNHPVVQQRRPHHPVKGYPQQKDEPVKGAKSLVQQAEAKGIPRQRPYYPVKGYNPQQTQQQTQGDVQQRQHPTFPVKGQRQTRSVNYEQDFDQSKVGQGVKGRKGGIKGVPKAPTKNVPRTKGGKAVVEDVKVVQQEAKVAMPDVESPVQMKEQKAEEQIKVVQESVPVVKDSQEKVVQEPVPVVKVSQEKVAQESVPVVHQEKVVKESVPVVKVSQENVVQEPVPVVKVSQESFKAPQVVPEAVKSVPVTEQVKDAQVKSEDFQTRSEESVKGQTVQHIVVAVANGVGSSSDGSALASSSASASAVVVVAREEPSQIKEDVKVKSDEVKQARHLVGKVGSPVKGVPFHRKKISQQKEVTVQQNEQVAHEPQVVQQDQTVQQN